VLLSTLVCVSVGQQHPFSEEVYFGRAPFVSSNGVSAFYENGTSLDTGSGCKLEALESQSFVTLEHHHHPGHRVRVKKTDFCDSTVK
jgi:hypothetical protein